MAYKIIETALSPNSSFPLGLDLGLQLGLVNFLLCDHRVYLQRLLCYPHDRHLINLVLDINSLSHKTHNIHVN